MQPTHTTCWLALPLHVTYCNVASSLFMRRVCLCCRAHEQDLSKRHERELGELSVVHHRETQIMLADFNKAQEVLKDKISALQIL